MGNLINTARKAKRDKVLRT